MSIKTFIYILTEDNIQRLLVHLVLFYLKRSANKGWGIFFPNCTYRIPNLTLRTTNKYLL